MYKIDAAALHTTTTIMANIITQVSGRPAPPQAAPSRLGQRWPTISASSFALTADRVADGRGLPSSGLTSLMSLTL